MTDLSIIEELEELRRLGEKMVEAKRRDMEYGRKLDAWFAEWEERSRKRDADRTRAEMASQNAAYARIAFSSGNGSCVVRTFL